LEEVLQESSESVPDQHEVGDHAFSKQPASPIRQPDQTSEIAETSQPDQSADVPDPEVLHKQLLFQRYFHLLFLPVTICYSSRLISLFPYIRILQSRALAIHLF
jgi:hypothetical protein